MIEKGNINLGLVASIVIGLLIGWLLINFANRLMRPAPAPAPTAPKPKKPIGFKEPETSDADDPDEKTDAPANE